jgi:hypothetical protein
MRKYPLVFLLIFVASVTYVSAQRVATFEVLLDKPTNGLSIPAKTDLDAVTFLPDSLLSLAEVRGNKRIPVPYQIETTDHRVLHWLVESKGDKSNKRVYELVATPRMDHVTDVMAKNDSGAITICANNKNLLRYFYKTVYPPAGQDTNYKRSGFIHPLWTPHGQELTRIQAPDHYHHYGIWNPWTHVYFEKDTVDFWNIKGHQGTVRFAKLISSTNGPVYSEYEVLHEHVVFKKNGTEKVALNELQTVRIYQPEDNSDYYIVDITSKMSCASESPFLIVAYRYAGLGWRTTGFWDSKNCEVLTSEGKTRKDTDGSTAKWCIVQGALNDDYGGAAFLSYPANYNHPEPMRIWTENMNGRGDMFFNFAPTKDKNWLLEPGKTYTLKYRLVVFNGHFTKEKAESAWQYFAASPKVMIKTN